MQALEEMGRQDELKAVLFFQEKKWRKLVQTEEKECVLNNHKRTCLKAEL